MSVVRSTIIRTSSEWYVMTEMPCTTFEVQALWICSDLGSLALAENAKQMLDACYAACMRQYLGHMQHRSDIGLLIRKAIHLSIVLVLAVGFVA